MTPEGQTVEEAILAFCAWCQDRGIVVYAVFTDTEAEGDGWHMAGPKLPGPVLAQAFRSVAAQCEAQFAPEVVN